MRKIDILHVFRQFQSFRWFLFLWLGLTYIWGLRLNEGHSHFQNNNTALFTILMALHAGVYWLGLSGKLPKRWLAVYFLMQSLLVLLISVVTLDWTVPLGLYLALIGATVVELSNAGIVVIAVLGYLVLFILSIWLLGSWTHLQFVPHEPRPLVGFPPLSRLLITLEFSPLLVFAAGYIFLFHRQTQAHERAKKLIHELEAAHSELAQTHEQLQEAHTQLVSYAQQVEDLTLMNERQRMARELHDTLAQGLAGLIMQLEAVNLHFANGETTRAREITKQAMARARRALTESRRAIDNLRTTDSILDLLQAVQEEIKRFSSMTGISCHADLACFAAVPQSASEHVLSMVSEGLTNVARHAQATRVSIHTIQEQDIVIIEMSDDGVGFTPSEVMAQHGHYGLLGIRERARLAGGILEVKSAPGEGTTLRLSIPMVKERIDDEYSYPRAHH